MRYANENYILGVPERMLLAEANALGWTIRATTYGGDAVTVHVRRSGSVFARHDVVLHRALKRRHVVDAFKVQLRMLGA